MTRKKNYDIGYRAEDRIREFLKEHGCNDVRKGEHNGYPDIYFSIGGASFAAECKTVLGLHNGKRMGVAKLSRIEYEGMNLLAADGAIPCMIVEIRSRRGSGKGLLFVPWPRVVEKFNGSNPEQLSLTFWWVLKHGINLEWWIRSRRNA